LNNDAVVIDLVYGSRPTPLVGTTRERQQIAIDGRDVLVTQVRHQFRMMTGKEMPSEVLGVTLECGGLAPLWPRTDPIETKRRQAAALQGDAQS